MPFTNPIIAGTTLIRTAIKSPDYVPGVSGWSINKDGTAEFNDVEVRGSIHAEGPTGAYVDISNTLFGGGAIELKPSDFTNPTIENSQQPGIVSASMYQGASNGSYLELRSPSVGTSGNPLDRRPAQLILFSGTYEGDGATAVFEGAFGDPINVTIDGNDIGKGWVAGAGITSSNAAVNATETVQLTSKDAFGATYTFKAGRIYKVIVTGGVTTAATTFAPVFRIRKANVGGQQLDVWRSACQVAAQTYSAHYTTYFQVGASDVTTDIVVTLNGSAGVAVQLQAAATSPATLNIYDDGITPSRSWVATLV